MLSREVLETIDGYGSTECDERAITVPIGKSQGAFEKMVASMA
jgi:hypothetical protein